MINDIILSGAEQGEVDSVRTQQQSFRPFSDRFNSLCLWVEPKDFSSLPRKAKDMQQNRAVMG